MLNFEVQFLYIIYFVAKVLKGSSVSLVVFGNQYENNDDRKKKKKKKTNKHTFKYFSTATLCIIVIAYCYCLEPR